MFFKKQSETEFLNEFETHLNHLESFNDNVVEEKKQAAAAYLLAASDLIEQIQTENGLDLNKEAAVIAALISKGSKAELDEEVMLEIFARVTPPAEEMVKKACCCKSC